MTRGTTNKTDGFGQFSTGRLSRRSRRRAEGGRGGDPGNLWRQSPHPLGLRSSRRRRLCRDRAGDLRSHPARFPVRLFAGRGGECAQIHRQSGLGGDAARHPGRDRCRQGCRPGRHHRLLPRRQHRLCRRDQAVGPVGCDRLLRRRRRPLRRRQAAGADPIAFRREGCRDSARRCRDHQDQNGPRSKSTSIPARSTVFTATSGPATTRPAPISPGRAAWRFLRSI